MSDDFETVVKLTEKDIEILGGLFTQHFVKCNREPEPVDCSLQSALFRKILDARESQIIQARAAGDPMTDEKFLRNVDEALGNWLGEGAPEPPRFGGQPGEPVPVVDPEDVKTVWQIGRDAQANHPGQNVAVGVDIMKHACKPGADTEAVGYRSMLVWMMTQIAPEQLARFLREGQPDDAVFRAAAKVRAEWMGVGIVRGGLPFDMNEFLRLCGEVR